MSPFDGAEWRKRKAATEWWADTAVDGLRGSQFAQTAGGWSDIGLALSEGAIELATGGFLSGAGAEFVVGWDVALWRNGPTIPHQRRRRRRSAPVNPQPPVKPPAGQWTWESPYDWPAPPATSPPYRTQSVPAEASTAGTASARR